MDGGAASGNATEPYLGGPERVAAGRPDLVATADRVPGPAELAAVHLQGSAAAPSQKQRCAPIRSRVNLG